MRVYRSYQSRLHLDSCKDHPGRTLGHLVGENGDSSLEIQDTVHAFTVRTEIYPSIFFLSCLRPLVWPYPYLPLCNKTDKNYLNSPVPIFGTYHHNDTTNFAEKWQTTSENVLHFNLDDEEIVGEMLPVYLAKLLASHKLLDALIRVQEQIKDEIQRASSAKNAHEAKGANNMVKLLCMQAIQLIRFAISLIYLRDFDKKLLESPEIDIDKVKLEILKKSNLPSGDHKLLLDTQLFSYFVERVHLMKNERERHLF